MENSLACPRCDSNMVAVEGRMQCVKCPYSYNIPKRTPSHSELLAENEQLRKKVKELEELWWK